MWLLEDCASSRVCKEMQRATKKSCQDGDTDVASHVDGAVDAGGWDKYPKGTGLDLVDRIIAYFCQICPVLQAWSGPASSQYC